MNYATIKTHDIANGTGVRVSLFVTGCTHYCKNCFNAEIWSFDSGKSFTDETMQEILTALDHPFISGFSLLGGEPMHPNNQPEVLRIVQEVKKAFPNKTVWCYTGYDFDHDIVENWMKTSEVTQKLVPLIDVIVDGKFVEELKDITLHFRGSANQRIIDVPASLASGQTVMLDL